MNTKDKSKIRLTQIGQNIKIESSGEKIYVGNVICDENKFLAALIVQAVNQFEALNVVAEACVKEISVHPGTDKRGHSEFIMPALRISI